MPKLPRLRTVLPSAVGLVLFVVALFVLRHELRGHTVGEIFSSLLRIPLDRLLLATILVTLCYTVMTLYDTLAFHFIRCRVPYRSVALTSFVAHALANSVGFVAVTSGSVRYRFYSTKGVSAPQVLHVVAFSAVTFWVGLCGLAAALFVLAPPVVPPGLGLPFASTQPAGLLLLVLLLAYLTWTSRKSERTFSVCGHCCRVPSLKVSFLQMAIGASEWLCAASAVYVLLPHIPELPYLQFLGVYILAQFSGIASQVPGGFGVFESIVIGLMPEGIGVAEALASVFVFRILFNLLPLMAATVILGLSEIRLRRRRGVLPLPA